LWYKDFAGPENAIYISMVREDSLVEYLTALFFLGAAIFSGLLAIRLGKNKLALACLFFTVMAGLTLFMGLEEISYGQRIFGIETRPEMAADNTQGELNLHNLRSMKWVAEDIAPGIIIKWGLFGWVAVALTTFFPASARRLKLLVKLAFPPWYVAPYFLPFAAWAYKFSYPWLWPTAVWQDQEPAEMFLGLGFFVFCAASYCIGKQTAADAPPTQCGVKSA
jgi:hypothetical protein